MSRHALPGRLDWIGIRAARREPVLTLPSARILEDGIEGDHAKGGKRAVTLIQREHLPVIASLLGVDRVIPGRLRRNLMISGVNLYALRKARLQIGGAVLQIEGPCPPCSRMEEEFGPGGYSALRGHGGWYASVFAAGPIRYGNTVKVLTG